MSDIMTKAIFEKMVKYLSEEELIYITEQSERGDKTLLIKTFEEKGFVPVYDQNKELVDFEKTEVEL
jgi:hypothetical protein